MKAYQLIGLIGILVLLICGFLPLAYLNDMPITIYPVFDNYDLSDSIWVWRDISAFSVTYGITLLLCIYLLIKKLKPGYLISASLSLVAFIFMYISMWLTSIRADDFIDVNFSYSLWVLLILFGYVFVYYGGAKIEKKKKEEQD